jgi:hypothetical protein
VVGGKNCGGTCAGPGDILDYLPNLPTFSVEGNVGAGSKPALLQIRSPDNFHPVVISQDSY